MSPFKTLELSQKIKDQLIGSVDKLAGRKILVLGDVGLDEYILGQVRKISPEAPVPVLEVEKEDLRLGLSANVAQNIIGLGGTPYLVSVIGNDSGAELLSQLLVKQGISSDFLVGDSERPTTRKSRVMAKHHHIVRVDYEVKKFISKKTEDNVLNKVKTVINDVDAMIVEDYSKGLVTETLFKSLVEVAHKAGKPIYVDPTRHNKAEFYQGADLLKPNLDEAVALAGLNYDEERDHAGKIIEIGQTILQKAKVGSVVITQGKEGMIIFAKDTITRVPTYARQVFDVTGAGDTVIATMSLALAAKLPLQDACLLANFAAGVVVGQIGCVSCSKAELVDYIQSTSH